MCVKVTGRLHVDVERVGGTLETEAGQEETDAHERKLVCRVCSFVTDAQCLEGRQGTDYISCIRYTKWPKVCGHLIFRLCGFSHTVV